MDNESIKIKCIKRRAILDKSIIGLMDIVENIYSDIISNEIEGSFFKVVIKDYKTLKESGHLEFSIDTNSPIIIHYEDKRFAIFKDFYISKDLSEDLKYNEICNICRGALENEDEQSQYKRVILVAKQNFDPNQFGATSIFYKSI